MKAISQMLLVVLAWTSIGCGPAGQEPQEAPDELPRLDYEVFVDAVQPVLVDRCSNPSCHGNAQRPLSLYAPQAHRLRPEDTFSDRPLSPEEKRANYDRARSFAVDVGGGPLLLTKPLAEDAGGVRHLQGEALFFSVDERDYRAIEAWLSEPQEAP